MRRLDESAAKVWEAVRRALGRLMASVIVSDLPVAPAAPEILIAGGPPGEGLTPDSGYAEPLWSPGASVMTFPKPAANAGGGNADLAAVSSVVGLNAALEPNALEIRNVAPPDQGVEVLPGDLTAGLAGESTDVPTAVIGGTPRGAGLLARNAEVARLSLDPPALPRRRGRQPMADWLRLRGGESRSGKGMLPQMPMQRPRRLPPPGVPAAQAFLTEQRSLARSADAPLEDVQVLGVFPLVPVTAVSRLAIGERGEAVEIWLKPGSAGTPQKLVTLVLGRRRSTGQTIRTVL